MVSSNLIDIMSGTEVSDNDSTHLTTSCNNDLLIDTQLPQISIIDSFTSLEMTQSAETAVSNKGNNIEQLLSFECNKDSFEFDLINADIKINNQVTPDIDQAKNSLDDFDFLSSIKSTNNSQPSKSDSHSSLFKMQQTSIKSSSESNIFDAWGDTVAAETLQPEKPLVHSSSSGTISEQNKQSYDPFAALANLSGSNNFAPSPRKQPVALASNPGQSGRISPAVNKQATNQQTVRPNYSVFINPNDTGVFSRPNSTPTAPKGLWGMFSCVCINLFLF